MGLLARVTGAKPNTKKPTDDVLLIHGMLLMAGADGTIEDSEHALVCALVNTLPEFKDKDIDDLISQGEKIIAKSGGLKESVKAVAELSTPTLKKKLYLLAVDIAMSSGDVDEAEDAMLETYQRLLGVDDAFAQSAIQMMALKYATA
jgi:uncharacterized tellurite resistance protein B-like protein